MKKLSDDRLESFNTDYVNKHVGYERIEHMVDAAFPTGAFSFLDVGGGNGVFADRLLGSYPPAHGTVIDNARYLLDKNKHNERKSIVECSVETMRDELRGKTYDLIFFNWVLHHFVENSYRASIQSMSNALKSAARLLSHNGLISILENCYLPRSIESLPSKIIYHSLSLKSFSFLTKRLGANTSGTGVCYLSEGLWRSMLEDAGLTILACTRTGTLKLNRLKKLLCDINGINVVHITARR